MNEDGVNWYEANEGENTGPNNMIHFSSPKPGNQVTSGRSRRGLKHQAEERTPGLQLQSNSPSGPPQPYVTAKGRHFWKVSQPLRAAHRDGDRRSSAMDKYRGA
ncbi:hypothetical protein I79_020103 [Cricetulus griseus]|uniref:Uncharacterized protein n=1 Tax=Cricetulus griseus TaxID=10029 RepID=G3I969_CRIGR|nr:hypothetical protein I79_020103 [Cricetulus griseus]